MSKIDQDEKRLATLTKRILATPPTPREESGSRKSKARKPRSLARKPATARNTKHS